MNIQLTPEDEKLIEERLKSGLFGSIEEVIHDALTTQAAEAKWFVENKDAIDEKLAVGIAQLDRGEGMSPDAARAFIDKHKAEFLRKQNSR